METLFWEQHYAPLPPADNALEPDRAWKEPNTGTVPSHCPQPRLFVRGQDRDHSFLDPTRRNSSRWQESSIPRAPLTYYPQQSNRSASYDQKQNPLSTGSPSRAVYRPQASKEDRKT
ncbi:hypothetical protein MRX96_057359 [Rhipicephalus microplus]